jgi:hypothetical protein
MEDLYGIRFIQNNELGREVEDVAIQGCDCNICRRAREKYKASEGRMPEDWRGSLLRDTDRLRDEGMMARGNPFPYAGVDFARIQKEAEKLLEPKEVNKVNKISEKNLSKDVKDLIKAGYLNESMGIYSPNKILEFVVTKFQAELAVEARKELKAAEEE